MQTLDVAVTIVDVDVIEHEQGLVPGMYISVNMLKEQVTINILKFLMVLVWR